MKFNRCSPVHRWWCWWIAWWIFDDWSDEC